MTCSARTGFLPPLGGDSVERRGLLQIMRTAEVVTVVTPAGFGKTTLVIQHAERQQRPIVRVSLDRHDDDAVVLVSTQPRLRRRREGMGRAW